MPIITISNLEDVHWEQSKTQAFELENSIAIWRIKIGGNYTKFMELLTQSELEKMNRYHTQQSRAEFAVSRGALRYFSGKYMRESPHTLQMEIGYHQKPYWQGRAHKPPMFSIAHSGEYVLIAFANEAVGIDIEKINPQFGYEEILARCFQHSEIGQLQKAGNQHTAFYLHWTRKEALLKATAKGINNELALVPCINGQHQVSSDIIGSEKDWMISSFEMENNYAVSIAYPNKQIKPCLRAFVCR
jgi:4'-phosphopantetheinyl transferase